jgi:hypothetical protein
MSQNHFTVTFPLKSPADAKVLAEQLPPLMPQLFQTADTIGTIYYSRFTVLSEKTLLFLGDFDGEFGQLMSELARHAGPVFDAVFEQSVRPTIPFPFGLVSAVPLTMFCHLNLPCTLREEIVDGQSTKLIENH